MADNEKKLSEAELKKRRQARREREKQRQEMRRRRKRKVLILRGALALVCVLGVVLILTGVSSALRGGSRSAVGAAGAPDEVPASEVRHFSFTADLPEEEFGRILEDLYQRGYVLVDIHQLAAEDRDGNLVQGSFPLKEGQTPFVLSLRDFTLAQEEDPLVNCLEAFLKEHRDFSYKKARGLLGLSKGFAGDLGEEERKEALEDLKDRGWSLASCGYEDVSYGSELSLVQEDAEQWKTQVEPYAGETDVLIFPEQTDLGSWSSYGTEDPKYTYLRGLGFRYFCVEDANPSFVQVGEDFVHQGIREIDSYQEYTELMQ